jgi:hypothetical protein
MFEVGTPPTSLSIEEQFPYAEPDPDIDAEACASTDKDKHSKETPLFTHKVTTADEAKGRCANCYTISRFRKY